MATNIERATQIVGGILGKTPTQEQVIKAVDSVWFVSNGPELVQGEDPETRAGFFCDILKNYVGMQIQVHGKTLAQAAYQDDINTAAGDYMGDFTDPTPEQQQNRPMNRG